MALFDRQYHEATWWATNNPVLGRGTLGFDTTNYEYRVGDGVTAWTGLTPHPGADYGMGGGWGGSGGGSVDTITSPDGSIDVGGDGVNVTTQVQHVDASKVQVDTTGWVAQPLPNPMDAQALWDGMDAAVNGVLLPTVGTLGTSATKDVGTGAGDVAAGDDPRFQGELVTYSPDADDPTDWKHIPISSGTPYWSDPIHAVTNINGRLRIASDPGDTVDVRECWVLDDTDGWEDSEIRSVWWGPDPTGSDVVQPGHVHRASATGGIVIDMNVINPGIVDHSGWQWDGNTLINHSLGGVQGEVPSNNGFIDGWQVTGGNLIVYADMVDWVPNDFRISGVDPTVTGNWTGGTYPEGLAALGIYGPVALVPSSGLTDSPYAATRGSVTGQTVPSRRYPVMVATVVRGSVSRAKCWVLGTPEPPYTTSPGLVKGRFWRAWSTDLTGIPGIPASGKCGLVSNHLAPGTRVEFSDIEMRRL